MIKFDVFLCHCSIPKPKMLFDVSNHVHLYMGDKRISPVHHFNTTQNDNCLCIHPIICIALICIDFTCWQGQSWCVFRCRDYLLMSFSTPWYGGGAKIALTRGGLNEIIQIIVVCTRPYLISSVIARYCKSTRNFVT